MKKGLILIFVFVLVMGNMMFMDLNVQADDSDVSIISFETSEDVEPGDEFTLSVEFLANVEMTDVTVRIEQTSSIYSTGESPEESITGLSSGDRSIVGPFELKYTGGSNAVDVVFTYNDDETATKTIYVDTEEEDTSTPKPSTNPSQYRPQLEAQFEDMPVLKAGLYNKLKFTVTNTSTHKAENIIISLEFPDTLKDKITIDQLKFDQTCEKLEEDDTAEFEFKFNMDSSVEQGTYPLYIHYKYNNIKDIEFDTTETIYAKVQNDYTEPDMVVDSLSFGEMPLNPDQIYDLNVELRNMGRLAANNVKVTLSGLDQSQMTIFNSTDTFRLEQAYQQSGAKAKFPVKIMDDAETGSYPVTVTIEYEDSAGKVKEVSTNAYVYIEVVEEEEKDAKLVISNVAAPAGTIEAGREFMVSFNLDNQGEGIAKNVSVKINHDSGVVPKTLNPVLIESMNPGESRYIEFRFLTTKDLSSKYYPLEIQLDYEKSENDNTVISTGLYTGIDVEAENKEAEAIPKIIVDEYGFNVDEVKAGQEFELLLTLHNTSKTGNVNNIKITVDSSDGSFVPTQSSNSIFVEKMMPDEKITTSIALYPKNDLATKSYQISTSIEYQGDGIKEDSDGNAQHTEKETISIPVMQEPRLEVNDFNLPAESMMGTPIDLYVDFFNMGRGILHNLMVKVEGDFTGDVLSYFVGEFQQGYSDYFEASLFPKNEGANKGTLLFTFEDDLGNVSEIRKEFEINAVQMEMPENIPGMEGKGDIPAFQEVPGQIGPDGMPTGKPAVPRLYLIVGGVLGLVILVVVIILIRRARRKKKERALDEEY